MIGKITDRLAKMNPKRYIAIFGSIMFILLIINAFLIASLIESLYLEEVNKQMYEYINVDCAFEENSTFIRSVIIQDGVLVKQGIVSTKQIELISLELDLTVFLVNISVNVAIVTGSIIIKDITFVRHLSDIDKIHFDYSISTINTTIDRWNLQTNTSYLISFRTYHIAKSLEVVIPFWLTP